MSHQEELNRAIEETQNKFAELISKMIRSINDKKSIVEFLNTKKPPVEILKRINAIAIENEDYETCDAIKEYTIEHGINL
ncbi:hypothetical protein [Fluviicola taffensis]|uniref:Uncharacterized protein n=1 Tax=Fluviicola taffensis (strain DSM 16823 / NCIMB 13979 / RW262) TaxID=755732 RepID=F2I9W1_FLUTR|nr:hypothetical protein [Fluviicola taffensis]AEA44119.1 hypothetical protein Fluta_2133 [Fluviicola taffensis DSM 16823]